MKKTSGLLALAILFSVLIVYAGVTYLIQPVREKIDSVEQEILKTENDIKTTYYTVTSYDAKTAQLMQLGDAIAPVAEKIYSYVPEEVFLDNIRENIQKTGVSFTSMTASSGAMKQGTLGVGTGTASKIYATLVPEEGEPSLKEDKFNTYYTKLFDKGGRLETDVEAVTVSLEVDGTYNQILNLIAGLTGNGKSVIVNSMTMDIADNISLQAGANPEVRFTVSLVYVEIPDGEQMGHVEEPEALAAYTLPQDILSGSYRSFDSFSSLVNSVKNFFEVIFS